MLSCIAFAKHLVSGVDSARARVIRDGVHVGSVNREVQFCKFYGRMRAPKMVPFSALWSRPRDSEGSVENAMGAGQRVSVRFGSFCRDVHWVE